MNALLSKNQRFQDLLRYYVADIVYGGNDGIVTTFAVISGVVGAKLSLQAMFVIAVVNLLADGFSMASSSYLSSRSQADAHQIEHSTREAMSHAIATFVAFVFFGGMPLLGFLIAPIFVVDPFIASAVLTGVTMFVLGAVRSAVSTKKWYTTGLENLSIGTIASLVAYGCGLLMAHLMAE